MSPQEFASKVAESTEHERLQVMLLQRIAGRLNVVYHAVVVIFVMLLLLMLSLA